MVSIAEWLATNLSEHQREFFWGGELEPIDRND
jgi:hypothetical protein